MTLKHSKGQTAGPPPDFQVRSDVSPWKWVTWPGFCDRGPHPWDWECRVAPAKDFRGQSAFSKDKDACKRQDQFYGDRLSALAMCEMDFGSVLSVRGGAVPGGPPPAPLPVPSRVMPRPAPRLRLSVTVPEAEPTAPPYPGGRQRPRFIQLPRPAPPNYTAPPTRLPRGSACN